MTTIIQAHVNDISALSGSVIQVLLQPDINVPYYAGQYLQVVLDDDILSYSIANAPSASSAALYELHIRHYAGNIKLQKLLTRLHTGQVTIQLPYGHCHIQNLDEKKPILFIAGGTGFAPVKAMLEGLFVTCENRSIELVWGVRNSEDIYLSDRLRTWQKQHQKFSFYTHVSGIDHQLFIQNVLQRYSFDFRALQIVLSGPADMAYSFRNELLKHGVNPNHLFSDAFTLP